MGNHQALLDLNENVADFETPVAGFNVIILLFLLMLTTLKQSGDEEGSSIGDTSSKPTLSFWEIKILI